MLMEDELTVKVCDFGWSVFIGEKERKTCCGTQEYLAPEILQNQSYSFEIDLWTLGILCYEMSTGLTPFLDKNASKMNDNVKKGEYNFQQH